MKKRDPMQTVSGGWLMMVALMMVGCSVSRPPLSLGVSEGRLTLCPSSPNCVASQASDANQQVQPLRYAGDAARAQQKLLEALKGMERVRIVQAESNYIHAEFHSALFGFVDDMELLLDSPGVIQVRSASRTGYYDFGVNRKRVETLRARFADALKD